MLSLIKRIYDISFKHHLSLLNSCLTCVGILDKIYATKQPEDKVILSEGHAGIALYVVLEKYGLTTLSVDTLVDKYGQHPSIDIANGISCSTGSLGHGFGIATGIALTNKDKTIYCIISDGEAAEGSIYETLNLVRTQNIKNIQIFVNANGYGAYCSIDTLRLYECFKAHLGENQSQLHFYHTKPLFNYQYLQGLVGHYHRLTKEEYDQFCKDHDEKKLYVPDISIYEQR